MTKFHIEAEPNSPIWGSAQDMKDWLKQWHADGCPVKVKTALPQSTQRSTKEEQARIQKMRDMARNAGLLDTSPMLSLLPMVKSRQKKLRVERKLPLPSPLPK